MSALHRARRGAERFDSLLRGEQGAATSTRDLELLEFVGALRELPRPEPRPAFTADLRERLMVAAEAQWSTGTQAPDTDERFRDLTDRLTVPARRTPRERRLAVALGGFAIVGATTSMAVAAQHALPGDTLYPLKRAIENAEAGFSVSDSARGSTILENASGRLHEVTALAQDGDVDGVTVSETLVAFTDQATEASELLIGNFQATGSQDSINQLRDFTATSIEQLAALEAVIPAEAQGALLGAAQTVLAIDGQAAVLCPQCSSLGIVTVPPLLVSEEVSTPAPSAATDTTPAKTTMPKQPTEGRSNGAGGTSAEAQPSNPVAIPGQSPGASGSGGGKGENKNNGTGLPPVSVPTNLPPLEVPAPGEIVSGATEGVNDLLGGVVGNSDKSEK